MQSDFLIWKFKEIGGDARAYFAVLAASACAPG